MNRESPRVAAAPDAAPAPHRKIRSVDELAAIAAQARAAGKTVVLAHGTFDLLHIGHVRHLESARRQGDLLLVTVTADEYVNKGPGRPAFPEGLRAEMLASLQIVDWVAVNHHATAEQVLHRVQPNVYVKGPDYAKAEDDITGKITDERKAVEQYGGRLVVTDDVTFSSSALINDYLQYHEPEVRAYLDELRRTKRINEINDLFNRVAGLRVLVVGDTIIDEYCYVQPLGKSPKENMIATLASGSETFAGGVIAAANHIAGLCAEVDVVTLLGERDSHEELVRDSLKPNCRLRAVHRPDAPTTRKSRFIDTGNMRKLFEVYHMDDSPLIEPLQGAIDAAVGQSIGDYDLVVVTDFGHAMVGRSTRDLMMQKARFLAVNTQTNSANTGFNLITKYPRTDYVCIDTPEALLAVGEKHCDIENLPARLAADHIDCRRIAVTRGPRGCVTYAQGGKSHFVPAFAKSVVDTVGAGDAFFTVTAPIAAVDGAMDLLGFIGNLAGAIKVGIVGHRRSIDRVSLQKAIAALLK